MSDMAQSYVEYEMRVIVKRPAIIGPHSVDKTVADKAVWMCGFAATSELEREIVRALRVLDGDCEAQIVSAKRGSE